MMWGEGGTIQNEVKGGFFGGYDDGVAGWWVGAVGKG